MVSHLIKSKPCLDNLLHRIRAGHTGFDDLSIDAALALTISESNWSSVKLFYSFLKPFKEATMQFSGSAYPTLGGVTATYTALLFHTRSHLEKAQRRLESRQSQHPLTVHVSGSGEAHSFARIAPIAANSSLATELATSQRNISFFTAVLSKLTAYENNVQTRWVVIAAGLDPRYKSLNPRLEALLIHKFKDNYQARFEAARQTGVDIFSPPCKRNTLSSLIAMSSGIQKVSTTYRTIEDEVRAWVASEGVSITKSSFEILSWWRTSGSRFARLGMMAKDFLAIPASSVPSESAFSRAGANVDKKRSRLGDTAVRQLSELQSFQTFNQGAAKAAEDAQKHCNAHESRHRDECILDSENDNDTL